MPVPVVMQSHGVVNTLVMWNIIDYALEQALVEPLSRNGANSTQLNFVLSGLGLSLVQEREKDT